MIRKFRFCLYIGAEFLAGGLLEVRRGCDHRRWERDGGDLSDDDLASALLVDLGFEDVLGGNEVVGFRRLGMWWGAVREITEDMGGGGLGRQRLCGN